MPTPPTQDPIAALNDVLNEVFEVVQDVKQAHRKVPQNHELHAQLEALLGDLGRWVQRLIEEDSVLGAPALGSVPSAAGRSPRNFWPTDAPDDEVRRVVGEHLSRLADHVAAALADQRDDGARAVLREVQDEVHDRMTMLRT
jgi:hypothetical protein